MLLQTKQKVDHSWAMVLDEEKREQEEMDAALAEHKSNSQKPQQHN